MILPVQKFISETSVMTFLRTLIMAVGLGALVLGVTDPLLPAAAQSQPTGEGQLQDLIKELKTQLQRGERERLIDPWFLRDLRETIGRYEYPWGKRLFSDDFSGRGPQPDPPWQITAGEFLIDWRYGLRSVVRARPQAPEERQVTEEEAIKQLFGEILKEAIRGKEEQREPTEAPLAEAGFAAAIAPVTITNAFALRLEMTSRVVEGVVGSRFEFGPYQGKETSVGYRLVYMPGVTPSLELISVSPRGTVSTIELYSKPLELEDGQVHIIEWTRDAGGRMVIRVDGTEVMNVADRRFRERFDGFAVVNSGGDYALRSITIDGTG